MHSRFLVLGITSVTPPSNLLPCPHPLVHTDAGDSVAAGLHDERKRISKTSYRSNAQQSMV